MRISLFVLFLLNSILASSQFDYRYDVDLPGPDFHRSRREAFRALMPEKSVAVFFAAPVRNRSNDVDYQYHQSPDFYYLTGLNESNSVLVLSKDSFEFGGQQDNEYLFVSPKDPHQEIWTGRLLGSLLAKEKLGFRSALVNKEFNELAFSGFEVVLLGSFFADAGNDPYNVSDIYDLQDNLKKKLSTVDSVNVQRAPDILIKLREIKQPVEIELLNKAISITCKGLRSAMIKADSAEYEYKIQAIIEYEFKKGGAEYPGFPSIIGSGENNCILHYTTSRRKMSLSDLVVCDVGAEYHGYTADVTRTIPINGKFSNEQKAIYDLVLKAQKEGIKACIKDSSFYLPGKVAISVISEGLVNLGIIKKKEDYIRYFYHGTSHDLGLDVHDGRLSANLSPGNVITVEPGIYIKQGSDCDPKWWNIGVRIEDDILITNTEPVVLSDCIPREINEIEEIMKK